MVGASLLAAPGAEGFLGALLAALMLAIAVIDSGRYIIPNELTAAALALALLRAGLIGAGGGLGRRALGGVAGRRRWPRRCWR